MEGGAESDLVTTWSPKDPQLWNWDVYGWHYQLQQLKGPSLILEAKEEGQGEGC